MDTDSRHDGQVLGVWILGWDGTSRSIGEALARWGSTLRPRLWEDGTVYFSSVPVEGCELLEPASFLGLRPRFAKGRTGLFGRDLLGWALDQGLLDEVGVLFCPPHVELGLEEAGLGGAPSDDDTRTSSWSVTPRFLPPVAGQGVLQMPDSLRLGGAVWEALGPFWWMRAQVIRGGA